MRSIVRIFGCVTALGIGFSVAAPAVVAHESRDVGAAQVVVGWAQEPAFAGLPNAIELRVFRGDDPIEGLDDLQVEVRYGDETLGPLSLDPVFDSPGEYGAEVVPTVPGAYAFHVTGTIDGQSFDETFEPGPDTFNEVQSSDEIEFPQRAPSNVELAQAVDQLNSRMDEAPAEAEDAGRRMMTVAALVLGGIALVVSVVALVRKG